jgi:hypothetical protein
VVLRKGKEFPSVCLGPENAKHYSSALVGHPLKGIKLIVGTKASTADCELFFAKYGTHAG